jgi:hypothetical protein
MPINLTNPIDVAGGQPAVYRARPTRDLPAMHPTTPLPQWFSFTAKNSSATRNTDYAMAESALLTMLLASIGDTNTDLLATAFPGVRPYALTSRRVVDLMTRKHGIATSDDITKLREPLSLALTSLSELESHMAKILLASQRLTRSGQGETPYHYFELYLLTVAGFPSVALSFDSRVWPHFFPTWKICGTTSFA